MQLCCSNDKKINMQNRYLIFDYISIFSDAYYRLMLIDKKNITYLNRKKVFRNTLFYSHLNPKI